MAVEFTAGEDENAARRCIEQAGSRLANVRADIPADFVARLYSRVVPEDVVRYGAADLADLAKQAFDFLEQRTPGAPKIRCETVALKASGESQARSWPHRLGPSTRSCGVQFAVSMLRPPQPYSTRNCDGE